MSEKKRIKTLEEVAKELNEQKLGEFTEFTPQNGYYDITFRVAKNFTMNNGKICKIISLKNSDDSISYGYFKSRASYNSRYRLTVKHGNHYGEYLASVILKQLDIPACKVDIGTYPFKHPYKQGTVLDIEGALSHYELNQEENFIPISVIIENFKAAKKKKFSSLVGESSNSLDVPTNYTNIEVILSAVENYLQNGGKEEKIPEIRKQIFNMCLFDLKFANRDRHDDNFGLKVNQVTGDISFYNLFDNEQILGFQLSEAIAGDAVENEKRFTDLKKKEFTSCIGYPGKPQKVQPAELFKYLLNKYPKETIEAYNNVSRYTSSDLDNTLETVFPDMELVHKNLAKKLFLDRQQILEQTLQDYHIENDIFEESFIN